MIYDSGGNPVASRYRMSIFDWLVVLAVAEVAFFASCVPAIGATTIYDHSTPDWRASE